MQNKGKTVWYFEEICVKIWKEKLSINSVGSALRDSKFLFCSTLPWNFLLSGSYKEPTMAVWMLTPKLHGKTALILVFAFCLAASVCLFQLSGREFESNSSEALDTSDFSPVHPMCLQCPRWRHKPPTQVPGSKECKTWDALVFRSALVVNLKNCYFMVYLSRKTSGTCEIWLISQVAFLVEGTSQLVMAPITGWWTVIAKLVLIG